MWDAKTGKDKSYFEGASFNISANNERLITLTHKEEIAVSIIICML